MSIANTEQAEHWNTGPGVAHWVANQARYDRMHAPFTALILDAAALRPGGSVLDVGCGCGGTTLAAARLVAPGRGARPGPVRSDAGPGPGRRRGGRPGQRGVPAGRRAGGAARAGPLRHRHLPLRGDVLRRPGRRLRQHQVRDPARRPAGLRLLAAAGRQPVDAGPRGRPGRAPAAPRPRPRRRPRHVRLRRPGPAPPDPGRGRVARRRDHLGARVDPGRRRRERRRRGRVPAHRDAGPDHARRSRRRHRRPRARVASAPRSPRSPTPTACT